MSILSRRGYELKRPHLRLTSIRTLKYPFIVKDRADSDFPMTEGEKSSPPTILPSPVTQTWSDFYGGHDFDLARLIRVSALEL